MLNIDQKNPPGAELLITYLIISNFWQEKEQFRAGFILTNHSRYPLRTNWSIYFNYVRMIFPDTVSPGFTIRHINGDYFVLTPDEQYEELKPGATCTIEFSGPYWVTKISDAPSGFYIVYNQDNGLEEIPQSLRPVQVSPINKPEQIKRRASDHLRPHSAEEDYFAFKTIAVLPRQNLCPVTPAPREWKLLEEKFILSSPLNIYADQLFPQAADLLTDLFFHQLQIELKPGDISSSELQLVYQDNGDSFLPSRYALHINSHRIIIQAGHPTGAFYAIQSLRQLMPSDQSGNYLPGISIKDQAQFIYRGLHLDVARNFHPPTTVKKLLDLMAYFKLNKFHFHLTDDEGWRLEIPGLSELTSLASKRGHTHDERHCLYPSLGSGWDAENPASPGNGYYSRDAFVDILRYAHARYIEVIPAIDLPGHARAAIRAMTVRYHTFLAQGDNEKALEFMLTEPEDQSVYSSVQMWCDNVVNVALPSTYRFITKVVDELRTMYEDAGFNLSCLHLGGDEVPAGVWSDSPSCRQLQAEHPHLVTVHDLATDFISRVHAILQARQIRLAGWEEICLDHRHEPALPDPLHVDKHIIPYFWNTTWGSGNELRPYQAANQGYQVVLCNAPNLYLDFAYSADPLEQGYYWGGFNATKDVFGFLPLSIFQSAHQDAWGNPIPARRYAAAPALNRDKQSNILGIQGQLWSETLNSQDRLEYMALPRMIALAERAWSKTPPWAEGTAIHAEAFLLAWTEFANRLGQCILPQLDRLSGGYAYRLSPPGAHMENGVLYALAEFPGLAIHYTLDGTRPTAQSPLYHQPMTVPSGVKVIKLCTVSTTGRLSRVVEIKVLEEGQSS